MSKKDRDKRLAQKRERKRIKRSKVAAAHAHPTSVRHSGLSTPTTPTGLAPSPFDVYSPIPFPSPVVQPPLPTKFQVRLGALLERIGPIVVASWSVPKSLADQLTAEGKPIPPSVDGYVLVDTGAGKTGIAQHTAEQLGLTPQGTVSSFGAHGAQQSIRYCADFQLAISSPDGQVLSLSFENHEVMGIPKMKESFDQFGVRDAKGELINVIGVLGREFLRHTRLHYNGPAGTLDFEIDVASVRKAPAVGAPAPKLIINKK